MKVCIIGAGITGLSVARLLQNRHDVTVYEKEPVIGGIARTKNVDEVAYHMVGGHCFNSKNKEVMDFVFDEILPAEQWHLVKRKARINFQGSYISYPIEYAVKEIARFDKSLALKITKDFLSAEDNKANNLDEWFRQKFGDTLAEEYFIPYNRKIWQMDPSEMSHYWVEGKLPLPNKEEFFQALIGDNEDTMPHSTFYYPNSNNQNTFIDALSHGLEVTKNFEVNAIKYRNNRWVINNELEFDLVISTLPLNVLPFIIDDVPTEIKEQAKKLKYNKVTNVLWKTKDVDATWTYYPSDETIFHRHIHIGNFFNPKINYTITESMGEHSYEEMIEYGKKLDYLIEPLDYNVSEYAYVVYDQNYNEATTSIKDYLESIKLYSIGRFGEWEYYNMDKCIESAMRLVKKIENNQSND